MPQPPPEPPGLWYRTRVLLQDHPVTIGLFALAGLVLGTVVALSRPTVYEADTRLLVGTFEAPAVAIPGYVLASQSIATDYARLAATGDVIDPLAEELDIEPGELSSSVAVTAIPQSAVVRVEAASAEPEEAIRIAEGMSAALERAVSDLNTEGDQQRRQETLALHAQAAQQLAAAQLELDSAERSLDEALANGIGGETLSSVQEVVSTRQVEVADLQLQVDGYEEQYTSEQGRPSTSSQIRSLGAAHVHEAPRLLQRAAIVLVAVVLATIAGLVVAGVRDRRRNAAGASGERA